MDRSMGGGVGLDEEMEKGKGKRGMDMENAVRHGRLVLAALCTLVGFSDCILYSVLLA